MATKNSSMPFNIDARLHGSSCAAVTLMWSLTSSMTTAMELTHAKRGGKSAFICSCHVHMPHVQQSTLVCDMPVRLLQLALLIAHVLSCFVHMVHMYWASLLWFASRLSANRT